MSINKTCTIVFLLAALICTRGHAQRVFMTMIKQQQRSYTVVSVNTDEYTYNLPLVILALPIEADSLGAYVTKLKVALKGERAILAVPRNLRTKVCADSIAIQNDVAFLETILQEVYDNFKIDRNRVYVIGVHPGCMIDSFAQRSMSRWILKTSTISVREHSSQAIAHRVGQLIAAPTPADLHYSLWTNPLMDSERKRQAYEDSIRLHRWEKRTSIEFRIGRFDMLGLVKTEEDKTYMDVTDAHVMRDLHISKWMNDSMAWFFDIGQLKVPQRQEFNGVRIEMGGGMILSLTWGLKYTFYRYKIRPYILFGTGPLSFMVFGGRFSQTSSQQQIKNKIEAEVRIAMQTKVGTGVEGRVGKRISVGAHILYTHSSEFKSAGSVRAIRGITNSLSVGYIIGVNKIQ